MKLIIFYLYIQMYGKLNSLLIFYYLIKFYLYNFIKIME